MTGSAFLRIPLALLVLGGVFVKASCADVSIELETLVRAHQPAEPETVIVLGPGGDDIRLSGALSVGAAAKLDALLARHPTVKRIHLTSEGGLADEGQAIGDVIAAHGLTTYVPDFCVSACALAFVRGTDRLMLENARIGFHAPFEEGLFGTLIEDDSSVQRAEYLAAGVDPTFVTEALAVAPSDLWIPKPERLIAAHVVTRVVDNYRFPDSNLDGAPTPLEARALVLRNFSILAPFQAVATAKVDRIAAWYYAAYQHGLSEGEVVEGLRRAVGLTVTAALNDADDRALVHAARAFAVAMAAAAASAPGDCLAIGATGDTIKAAHYFAGFPAVVAYALDHPAFEALATGADTNATLRAGTCAEARAVYATVLRGPDRQIALFMRRILALSGDGNVARAVDPTTRASMTSAAR